MRIATFILVLLLASSAQAARCTGRDDCTACKTCTSCKHCHKDGGTCGVSYGRGGVKPPPPTADAKRAASVNWVPYAIGGAVVAGPAAWWVGRRKGRS